jgi:hypothetical protein
MKNKKPKCHSFFYVLILVATIGALQAILVIRPSESYNIPEKIEKAQEQPHVASQATSSIVVKEVKLLTTKPEVELQIRAIADEMNFKWPDYLTRLANCESSMNPRALGDSGKSRGLFQIHKGYHPEVTDEMAFDIEFATKWTIDMINKGEQHQWSCNKIAKIKN